MQPMTIEQLRDACDRVLANAKELVLDAQLLAEHGRFPRAFSIGILALEEAAKLPMLRRVQTCLKLNTPVDWPKVDRRFRSHNEKLGLFDLVDFFSEDSFDGTPEDFFARLGKRGSKSELAKSSNEKKQDGFYVSISAGRITSPTDVIDRDAAIGLVRAATGMVKRFEAAEDDVERAFQPGDENDDARWRLLIELADAFVSTR